MILLKDLAVKFVCFVANLYSDLVYVNQGSYVVAGDRDDMKNMGQEII